MLPDTFGLRKILFKRITAVEGVDADEIKKANAVSNLVGKVLSHARFVVSLKNGKRKAKKK